MEKKNKKITMSKEKEKEIIATQIGMEIQVARNEVDFWSSPEGKAYMEEERKRKEEWALNVNVEDRIYEKEMQKMTNFTCEYYTISQSGLLTLKCSGQDWENFVIMKYGRKAIGVMSKVADNCWRPTMLTNEEAATIKDEIDMDEMPHHCWHCGTATIQYPFCSTHCEQQYEYDIED